MKKYKIGICGFLDRKAVGENGQTLRTLTVCQQIEKNYGEDAVYKISSHIWKKHPLKFFCQIVKMAATCENVIMFPDWKGVQVILPIFYCLRPIFRNKLFYNVIGAWLPDLLAKRKWLAKMIGKLDAVFVETKTLKRSLAECGVTNTKLFVNFKQLQPVAQEEIEKRTGTFKMCFFSRVHPQKGIEDAIWAVTELTHEGYNCEFDIYGPVDAQYTERFEQVCSNLPENIRYRGAVDAFRSVETLNNYHIQLFPTLFATEGIPGSIVDSFFAGVPVIASKWNSCADVVTDGSTGLCYAFGDKNELKNKIQYAMTHLDRVKEMSINCLEEAKKYDPDEAIKIVVDEIEKA